jgi:hypothetical protein
LRWTGEVSIAYIGAQKKFIYNFDVKFEANRPLGRARYSYIQDDNIKTDVEDTGCESLDWLYLAQDRDQWRIPVKFVCQLQSLIKGFFSFVPNRPVTQIVTKLNIT